MYKVLIVDDEEAIVSLLSDYLKLNNYEVLVAYDGAEAVRKAFEKPDIILLDVNMPKQDGFAVCSGKNRLIFGGMILIGAYFIGTKNKA